MNTNNPVTGMPDSASKMVDSFTDAAGDATRRVSDQVEAGLKGAREYVSKASEGFQKAADYVSHADSKQLADDLYGYVKTHPIHALATALAIGFVAGRLLRSNGHD